MIAPASNAGVVALKPTVGLVSSDGVLPVAKSQDAPGPIARTVYDAALGLGGLTGSNYTAGLVPTALAGKRVAVINSTTAPYPAAVTAITTAGATTAVKTVGTPSPNPASIVTTEFKRDLNAYFAGVSGGAGSLTGIINYNAANAVEGLKYQQRDLISTNAVDLSNPATAATYEANKTSGKASNAALIDTILDNGTPADTADDFGVVMVPAGNALIGIADRAGYPVLTVPAGYGTGRNPVGVTFVGTAGSEAAVLAAGYAYEQASNVRLAPSFTNPSMFRCVPGSTFFSPHHCHPGDLQSDTAFGPLDTPVAGDVGGIVPATLSLVLGTPAAFGAFTPGVTQELHGVDHGDRDLHRGRRHAERGRPRCDEPGQADQRLVRTGHAAEGEGQRGRVLDGRSGRRGAAGLHRAGLERRGDGDVPAGHRRHRPAAYGRVLEDAHVHVVDDDAVVLRAPAVPHGRRSISPFS